MRASTNDSLRSIQWPPRTMCNDMTKQTDKVTLPGNDAVRLVHRQITAAAFLQASLFGQTWYALGPEKKNGEHPALNYIRHANHGYRLLLKSMGLHDDLEYVGLAFRDWKRPISSAISLTKSGMDSRIADIHGPEAAAVFLFAQALSIAVFILGILSNISKRPARQHVQEEVRAGHGFLDEIAAFLRTSSEQDLSAVGRTSRQKAIALASALRKSRQGPEAAALARTRVLMRLRRFSHMLMDIISPLNEPLPLVTSCGRSRQARSLGRHTKTCVTEYYGSVLSQLFARSILRFAVTVVDSAGTRYFRACPIGGSGTPCAPNIRLNILYANSRTSRDVKKMLCIKLDSILTARRLDASDCSLSAMLLRTLSLQPGDAPMKRESN